MLVRRTSPSLPTASCDRGTRSSPSSRSASCCARTATARSTRARAASARTKARTKPRPTRYTRGVPDFGFTPGELRTLRSLNTPVKVQRYLDELRYNDERGGATSRSPRRVLRDKTAQCAEGAFFAAAAFRVHGRQPLIVDLEGDRDDDHLLAVYRDQAHWGAV